MGGFYAFGAGWQGLKAFTAKDPKKKRLPVFFAIFAAFLCVLRGKVLSRQNDLR
jgi:hypothetical protein